MAKICKQCGSSFPLKVVIDGKTKNLQNRKYCLTCSPFGSHNTKKLEMCVNDTEAQKVIKQQDKYRRWQRKARRERKIKLVKMLGGKCSTCDYDKCYSCLDFHHEDETNKKFEISSHMLKKWDDLVEEAKKCIVLCRNCHGEVHYNKVR